MALFGLSPRRDSVGATDWRPMESIGAGVCEIRFHGVVEEDLDYQRWARTG